ncbi:MAG: hypothetical protein H7839_19755 [Magnetococcus sp. YQC-5]
MNFISIWRRIDQMSPFDKIVAQLLAIFYVSVSRTELFKALQKSEHLALLKKGALLNQQLESSLVRLAAAGLIVEEKAVRGVSGIRMPPGISWEAMREMVDQEGFAGLVRAVQETTPAIIQYTWGLSRAVSYDLCLREIRVGLLSNDIEPVNYFVDLAKKEFPEANRMPPFVRLCLQPLRLEWLASRTMALQSKALAEIMEHLVKTCGPYESLMPLLESYRLVPVERHGPFFRHIWVVFLLLANRLAEAREILGGDEPVEAPLCLRAWSACLQGDNERAIMGFEESLRMLGKGNKGKIKKGFLVHPSGPFFILALLKSGNRSHRRTAMEYMDLVFRATFDPYRPAYEALFALALVMDNRVQAAQSWLEQEETGGEVASDIATIHRRLVGGGNRVVLEGMPGFFQFFHVLAHYWIDPEKARQHIPVIKELVTLARDNGHVWMARESAALLNGLEGNK